MSSIPDGFPISLRSWPTNTKVDDPKHLPTIIKRINFERGGFQNITEESLRQEIAEAELNENGANEESSEEEDDEEPDRAKELLVARDELLKQIEQAHQAAMLCTEVVSAALTKETPSSAIASMSLGLRNLIGTGTLGMDKLHAKRISNTTREENKKTAKGWKIQALNKSVDSILAAAERLQAEVEHETIFWGQVLAISDNCWAICRLPYDKHTLGVRFGSSEASPTFRNRSLGALRRSEDGTITLDHGLANAEPQFLRVRIRTGDTETGASRIPRPVAQDAPIESLILEARNTIFSQELWLELNRESRNLGTYGVKAKGDTLILPLSIDKTIVLDLMPLGDSTPHYSNGDDYFAEGITMVFHLLLTLSHRHNHRKRTQPPAMMSSEAQAVLPPYNLLRPFLTRIKHQETISHIHALLRPLCRALGLALPKSSPQYNIKTAISERASSFPKPEQVLMRLTDSLEVAVQFTITEDISMVITARTQMSQIGSLFTVAVSPVLAEICPPPRPDYPFNTFLALQDYVNYATACGLAFAMSSKLVSNGPVPSDLSALMSSNDGWQMTAQSNILKMTLPSQKSKQLAISVHSLDPSTPKQGAKIRVTWEWAQGDVFVDKEGRHLDSFLDSLGVSKYNPGPGATKLGEGWYEWTSKEMKKWGDDEGEVRASLAEVVEKAIKEK